MWGLSVIKKKPVNKFYTYFQGFSKSHLYWNDTTNYWVLKDNKNSSIYAIQNETHDDYPFGVKKWYVFNDIDCINQENKMSENVYATKISLNNFNENLFNCLDGTRYVLELKTYSKRN